MIRLSALVGAGLVAASLGFAAPAFAHGSGESGSSSGHPSAVNTAAGQTNPERQSISSSASSDSWILPVFESMLELQNANQSTNDIPAPVVNHQTAAQANVANMIG